MPIFKTNPSFEVERIPPEIIYDVYLPDTEKIEISETEKKVIHRCELMRCEPNCSKDEVIEFDVQEGQLLVKNLSNEHIEVRHILSKGKTKNLPYDSNREFLISGARITVSIQNNPGIIQFKNTGLTDGFVAVPLYGEAIGVDDLSEIVFVERKSFPSLKPCKNKREEEVDEWDDGGWQLHL